MRHLKNPRPRATAAARRAIQRTHPAGRVYALLVLSLCVYAGWATLEASTSAAAAACTMPSFGPPTIYSAGFMRAITAADFDGDGNTDLASVAENTSGVLLYMGDGTGAFPFRGAINLAGNRAQSLATGDFDGDGQTDIVIGQGLTGTTAENVAVYLNQGLAFSEKISVFMPGDGATTSVAVGDFNSDGKPDLVTTESGNGGFIALDDGKGAFTSYRGYNSGGPSPVHVVVLDFNGDGKLDIAVANSGTGGNVAILLGDGAGNLGAPTTFAAGELPKFIAHGDFNSDNKIDLAVGNDTTQGSVQNVSILFGNGAGGFSAPTKLSSGPAGATNVAVADFNGDGKTDVAAIHRRENNVTILLGDGAGNFSLSGSYATGRLWPSFMLAQDLNHDGRPDFAFVHEQEPRLSVLLNSCGATNTSLGFNEGGYSVSEGMNVATVTVIRNGSLAGAVSVNYATSDGSATSPADYRATSGTLTFADGEASKSFTVELVNDTLDELTQTFGVTLSNPTGSAVLGGLSAVGVSIVDDDPTLTFSVNNASVSEGQGNVNVIVTRTSDPKGVASLDYRTTDADTFTVSCADTTNNNGGAFARCDFATVVGRLDFAVGETQKTITVPVIDDGHDEGAETFGVIVTNPERTGAGSTFTATVTLQDNDAAGAPNPVVASFPFFVRQQYLDFLSREPDQGGLNAWLGVLNNCANAFTGPNVASQCDRIYVSGEGFFRSQEFQLKGFYVFRFYKVAFGRLPEYTEIVSDMSFVAGQTAEEVYARKAQVAASFAGRPEFQNLYGSLTDAQYVSTLLNRYGLTQVTTPDPAQPDTGGKVTLTSAELTARLTAGTLSRAQVLRVVADSDAVGAAEFDNAFVSMQYYGYLRRKPDKAGFNAWLGVLQSGNVRTMVDGFLNSVEYKLRFGQP
ncbi:MAG: trimeric autotransporter adhesin [Pyrinomonadaceae bacterium]|nr:trimeric autotransporter adhesin [Pyrinomonadaceae bacterium]